MRYNAQNTADWPYQLSANYSLYGNQVTVAAVAAANSQAQLFLLSGLNWQVFVKEVWVSLATAGDVIVGFYNTALATDGGGGRVLHGFGGAGQAHVRQATHAGTQQITFGRFSLPAAQAQRLYWDWDFALDPGNGLMVEAVTVDIAMIVSFVWAEVN